CSCRLFWLAGAPATAPPAAQPVRRPEAESQEGDWAEAPVQPGTRMEPGARMAPGRAEETAGRATQERWTAARGVPRFGRLARTIRASTTFGRTRVASLVGSRCR